MIKNFMTHQNANVSKTFFLKRWKQICNPAQFDGSNLISFELSQFNFEFMHETEKI